MVWEYYGDALIAVGVLTTVLLICALHFLRSSRKRKLTLPLLLGGIGYTLFLIGLVFIRGWDGMGWSLVGFSLYAFGLILYIGVAVYLWLKRRRLST
ncbi:YesK family protein [Exiguobacterium alkaliphilum]|uniref:YesK family protein n=1 Tax=Exiguobacterium alkaliphilum TaxID=1428684 RepID=UPI0034639174